MQINFKPQPYMYIYTIQHKFYNIFIMSQEVQSLVQLKITYKNIYRIIGNVIAVAFGALYFGYTLAYFSIIPFAQLQKKFHIQVQDSVAKGIFAGLIPIGAGIGAALSSIVSARFSRKNSLLFVCVVSLIGALLVQIPSFPSLLIGRLIQGMCVGLYSSICPLFIKQISPIQLSGFLGTFNQIFIVVGIVITNVIAVFIKADPDNNINPYWRIIFAVPVIIVIVQAILLLLVYKNQTPKYLLLQGKQDEARSLIEELYRQQFVDEILNQKKNDINENKQSLLSTTNQEHTENKVQEKSNLLCTVIAIHLALLQQMCGVNVVILYGGQILNNAIPGKGSLMQIFLVSTQLIACLFTAYVLSLLGRKILLQIGTIVSIIVLVGLGIAYLPAFKVDGELSHIQQIIIVVSLFIFMLSFGFTLGPVVWLYIPEIVQPKIVPFSTLANWTGASFTILIFPIIGDKIGNQSLFFFLAIWCIASLVFNHFYVVETKDKTQNQIAQQFQKLVE